jgi:hypothetical protein
VESFTRVEPTKLAGRELKYGPYEDHPPYSFSPVIVHLENNSPFAVVEELLREVEISHWGNLQITEHYKLVHAGARHKGVFSRLELCLFFPPFIFIQFAAPPAPCSLLFFQLPTFELRPQWNTKRSA